MAAATLQAARDCARTLLCQSLRVQQLRGAVPHVMVVVDRCPCVQQKVLVEGYRQVLRELSGNGAAAPAAGPAAPLFIPLNPPTAETPCGAGGLGTGSALSYSIVPFEADTFLEDVRALRWLLRQCGTGGESAAARERFDACLARVGKYLAPFPQDAAAAVSAEALLAGPAREMLAFVLIQRNAFQNEMRRYRLRLTLFDLGMRVAEHCHLECMSAAADALAAAGQEEAALANDEVFSYARSCAFPPGVAECLGRAIAESVDQLSWRYEDDDPHAASQPPAAFARALAAPEVWSLFEAGALRWRGEALAPAGEEEGAAATAEEEAQQQRRRRRVAGVGAELQILCEAEGQCLRYSGGMEDCLLNTGYYAASERADRNDVHSHRALFPCEEPPAAAASASPGADTPADIPTTPAAAPRGRMKKKEYLAALRAAGERPNKKRQRADSDDDDEDGGAARRVRGAAINTSIGGTFPVGEVISESFDLSRLSGTCSVFAYPDLRKLVAMAAPRPFTLTIAGGVVTEVGAGAPQEFVDLVELVRQAEGGACCVRELGLGLNPFVGKAHVVSDVTSFERQWGVHLSLGQRHPLFVKQAAKRSPDGTVAAGVAVAGPVLKRKAGKFHIDVFLHATRLVMGDFELDFTKGVAVQ